MCLLTKMLIIIIPLEESYKTSDYWVAIHSLVKPQMACLHLYIFWIGPFSGNVQCKDFFSKLQAENFDGHNNPVLACKGCRLSDWGGRSLSLLASSQMIINPDIRESHILKGWYENEGHQRDFTGFRSEGGQAAGGGELGYPLNLIYGWWVLCEIL